MDNLTHTLVGAALGEAGLKRRTALASATLMIGANFPDIDVIAVPFGDSLTWRRGPTHGFLALAILPFVLAWLMQMYDRRVRLRRAPDAIPADFRQLLILSAISIWTHPTLDFMNTYGMRWLMPFVDRWFYADGLFIIDLWLWIVLIVSVVWARRANWTRPARAALAFLVVYMVVNLGITEIGRREVGKRYPGTRFMLGPQPVRSWGRDVVVDDGTTYRFGTWAPGRGLRMGTDTLAKGADHPAVAVARRDPGVRGFVRWARLPFYRVDRDSAGGGTVVRMGDARYTGVAGLGWASAQVRLP
jgi:inner membrane protein